MNCKSANSPNATADTAVFAGVSLDVAPGEFVAIVGESGVGKSTLLNCMAGLDSWDEGSVQLNGQDLDALSDDAARTAAPPPCGLCVPGLSCAAAPGCGAKRGACPCCCWISPTTRG
jgi:ABC-type lipoprotein export system ATPase subunit